MGLLDGLFGGNQQGGRGGMSPMTMALIGLFAYKAIKGSNKSLSDIFAGATGGQPAQPEGAQAAGGLGNILSGGLGSLLGGGSAGSLVSGGLGDLLNQFQQNGQGDKAQSWVDHGENKPIEPNELAEALGPDRIAWLARQSGMSQDELLAGLSRKLPEIVDRLTPDGRLPSSQEAQRLVA